MKQLIPLLLSANTVTVMWLAGSKRSLGWALGLAGQAGWLAFVVTFDAWGLLPLVVALTFVYSRNLWRWRSDSHEPAAPVGGGEPQPTTSTDNECTGLMARWCPVHGDCTCEPIEGVRDEGPGDDDDCPLHAPESPHPSAGGGDQPDTPCPHGAPGGWDCCRADREAPTDKENPHGH